jgi:hypothetical protein
MVKKKSLRQTTKKFLGDITPSGTDPKFINKMHDKLFPKK